MAKMDVRRQKPGDEHEPVLRTGTDRTLPRSGHEHGLVPVVPQRTYLGYEFSDHCGRQARDPPVADDCFTRRVPEIEDAKAVVHAGVDGLAHTVREPGPDKEPIDMILERDVFVFTSMSIPTGFSGEFSWLDDKALAETVSPADRAAARTN
ncbi:hypothetical protein [Streptomyces sp. NPDC059224]|uniref:hypothetical protein n=1 Tax=Streptomyces sp. NPDC059224 TaxID=3346775 RepID=UPI0036A6C22B